MDGKGQDEARALAEQQREVAAKLEEQGNADESGRADEMAREARQIAQQLESANLDASVLERQQRLFRKMLDAGRLLEEDQREDTGKREATSWTGTRDVHPAGGLRQRQGGLEVHATHVERVARPDARGTASGAGVLQEDQWEERS